MINLMCQLDWAKGCLESWWNIISECVCEGVSRRRDQHQIGRLREEELPSSTWAGIIQSLEGLNGRKRHRKGKITLSAGAGQPAFPALGLRCSWLLGLQTWARTHTTGSQGSQAFGFGLNCTTGFPGRLNCRQQILGLLSLHVHMSQFLITNLHLCIYLTIYLSVCLSIIYLSTYLSIYLSIYPSIYLSIHLSIYLLLVCFSAEPWLIHQGRHPIQDHRMKDPDNWLTSEQCRADDTLKPLEKYSGVCFFGKILKAWGNPERAPHMGHWTFSILEGDRIHQHTGTSGVTRVHPPPEKTQAAEMKDEDRQGYSPRHVLPPRWSRLKMQLTSRRT